MTNEEIVSISAPVLTYLDKHELLPFVYAAMDLARADERESKVVTVPYQLCPKCTGQGQVTKPPYTPGDVHEWVSSSIAFQCDVCNGSKIIPMFSPLPPAPKQ